MKLQIVVLVFIFLFGPLQSAWSEGSLPAGGDKGLLLQQIAGDDPEVQAGTLKELAEEGDPASLPLLTALHEGSLYRWTTDGAVRVVRVEMVASPDGEKKGLLVDPLTGERIGEGDGTDEGFEMISVGSSEGRRWVSAALDRIKLSDPSPEARRSAATKIGNGGDLSNLLPLTRALSRETDRWARHAMEEAVGQIQLADPDPAVRRAAAERLGTIHSQQGLPRLKALFSEEPAETDPAVRSALRTAIGRIEDYQAREQFVGTLFSGISLGSILLLMGLGLAITFGLMGVINMAHGEMMMMGAYTTFVLQEIFRTRFPAGYHDLYFIAALPLSFLVAAVVGWLLEKGVIRFLYGKPLETLLATWGISMILQQAARWYFGDLTSVNAPTWIRGGVQATVGLVLPYNRIFIIALSIVGLVGVSLLLSRTRWGLKIRAVTQNRDMSACLGISTRRVDGWTFALGAGLAGLAGCALSLVGNVDPEMGKTYIVDSFMVVVVGGVGKLAGTVVSAFGIGMLNKILEPMIGGTGGAIYAKIFILAAIILFLQRKPSGLFPAKGRAAESA
ncbi:urea ABC transporter permease subunit UrtB [Candidatus Manganitrophus noduliformans]|uniref:Urea ABC transporter permease subunit UrtB n=1 Tax=Candidatus Manganitrophus noduliformans TaxID=2606439 RepID=A0A7X6I9T4_9BACT|nr:urea ABC transporter permease subunit UrtB [Candidatus Manganitrophus noduliformans]NKE69654.1 urea ABC transporter permease subunit UrtB [Candidatus Manganitrophus noduliformans]